MSSVSPRKMYITTPLFYVNARPHIGHAYATILADVLARYAKQQGNQVIFLTGTDEHGEKIAAIAKKEARPPLEYSNEIAELFRSTWKQIGLAPDVFYRTTLPSHYALVQEALAQLKERGEIYFASYEGKYCLGCERFRTDQEWNAEGKCPDHLSPPDIREESNYFFKMSAYKDQLKAHYRSHPESIQPAQYMKETLSFLDQPLEDLCISRPKTRLEWGIPLPFDDKFVTYVWFDALLSYPGGLSYEGKIGAKNPSFKTDYWDQCHHVIGKDILKTHAIYWPTMLMALGLPLFKRLQVSGYWLTAGVKMSKSLGNVVSPLLVQERFGIETFRYFLLREMSYGADASFTWESFVTRCNAELANGLGNLASRTLTLVHKNLGAVVPTRENRSVDDESLLKELSLLPQKFSDEFENCRYHMALGLFNEAVAQCDRYINDNKPWALAKDPAAKQRLESVLGTAMDGLWILSIVGASVLPEGCHKLRIALGETDENRCPSFSRSSHRLEVGQKLGEIPRLFPRLELPKDEAVADGEK